MLDTLLAGYDSAVPRYTSYPTAPHFHPGVGADAYSARLATLDPRQPASIYLHVPFCEKLCWYCGCNTKITARYATVAAFANMLANELALVASFVPGRLSVAHVHWGGGTPTMLAPADFAKLDDQLRRNFDVAGDAEIAIEIDPRVLSVEMAHMLAMRGVSRASLGVQDFDPAVQAAINRVQSYEATKRAVDLLREAGIDRINFDLIYGLPRQTTASVVATIDRAAALRPDRLAVYGYAHVPWLKKHQRLIDETTLPDARARWNQSQAMATQLEEHGYVAIGLDHFARPADPMAIAAGSGALRRNFQGYTTDGATTLLGMGPSSIGAFADAYVQNNSEMRAWRAAIDGGALATRRGVVLSADDRLRRAAIERIMCDDVVDLALVAQMRGFGARYFAPEMAALAPLAADGLLRVDDTRILLTPLGRRLRRAIAAKFDRYLGAAPTRHSRAV